MEYLPHLGFLAAPTRRTSAYVDAMVQIGIVPNSALVLAGEGAKEFVERLEYIGVSVHEVTHADVNSPEIVDIIVNSSWEIVLFSGPGGAIARAPLLATGRRFLHIHPGALPAYRGSTTIYYSLIEKNSIDATALFLDEGIDTGPTVLSRSYPPPGDRRTIDHEYDPLIRASILKEILEALARGDELSASPQNATGGRTHYIIHPVLKHIAILAS